MYRTSVHKDVVNDQWWIRRGRDLLRQVDEREKDEDKVSQAGFLLE